MKFYQENKVNPWPPACRWSLQLPVFLALYYMLRTDLKHEICGDQPRRRGEPGLRAGRPGLGQFLFIPDLTDKATGGVLVVLIVLYVSSQLLSSILMPATVDKTQRMIFMALPFIFVPFIIQFPAGLHRLLDHDEPLDREPADRAAQDHGRAQTAAAQPGRDATRALRRDPQTVPQAAGGAAVQRREGRRRRREACAQAAGRSGELWRRVVRQGLRGWRQWERRQRRRTPREPGAKPPPPPRKRAKKRSGRRR